MIGETKNRSDRRRGLLANGAVALLIAVVAGGCDAEPGIEQYRAPKTPVAVRPSAANRMLGAILPYEDEFWFLKVTGKEADLGAIRDAFRALVLSFRVDELGTPSWELPSGWAEVPGDQFRYRTIRAPLESGQLDISVSKLPNPGGDLGVYVLSNVNRWRDQLGLPEIEKADLAEQTELVTRPGASDAYLVDYVRGGGPADSNVPTNEPANEGEGSRGASVVGTEEAESGADLVGTVPEGWELAAARPLRKVGYVIRDGGSQAEVTVSVAGGDVLANVNRWREQIQLAPWDEAQLASGRRLLTIAGQEASYFDLRGPKESATPEAILGVIAPRGDATWFIKMRGPAALVAREQAHFEQFCTSLRLP